MAHGLCILFTFALRPPYDVIGGAVRDVFDRLNVVLAKRHHHRSCHTLNLGDVIGHPKLAPLSVSISFLLLQVLPGAGLNLVGRVLIEAFDVCDLGHIDVSNFLDGREALCN